MMRLSAAQTDRAAGVLLGAAVGDALGAGYEFGSAPFDGAPAMIGGGLSGFAPGEWTDDTAQTHAVAEVAAGGLDLRSTEALDAVAGRFADWYAGSPPDVGVHTAAVLSRAGRHPDAATLRAVSVQRHRETGHTAGNGTLMRTAPVALAHLDDEAALVQAAVAMAELTHADPLGGEACALWCLALRLAVLTGELPDLTALTSHLPAERQQFWRDRIAEAESGPPGRFRGNGFVVTALQAAWSAVVHTPVPAEDPSCGSFACHHLGDALATAIGIGHDTDTVATIAGALLGARWGSSAVPWRWRRILHGWPESTGDDLTTLALLTVRGGRPDGQGWPGVERLDYSQWPGHDTLVRHPHDPGVWLGGADALDHLPGAVAAVVSLTRVGTRQVPAGLEHVTVRLIDTDVADNPNLAFVVDDAGRAVQTLRAEGRQVLLHCAAAQSRTPTVAARYSVLLGDRTPQQALAEVVAVLPAAAPRTHLRVALQQLGDQEM